MTDRPEPFLNTLNADMRTVILLTFFRIGDPAHIKSYAVILDLNYKGISFFGRGDTYCSAALFFGDPMLHRIFHDRLQREHGNPEIDSTDIILYLQLFLKTHLFKAQIPLNMTEFLRKIDYPILLHAVKIRPQILGKVSDRLLRCLRILLAQIID